MAYDLRRRIGQWALATGIMALLAGFSLALAQAGAPIPADGASNATLPSNETDAQPPERLTLSADSVKQGETLLLTVTRSRTSLPRAGATAWMAGVRAPLFLQPDGSLQGVMPVRVNQSPGRYALKIQSLSGETIGAESVVVQNARYSKQNIVASKKLSALQPEPGELAAVGALKTQTGLVRYWQTPFVAPTPDCMNSPFGNLRYHNGVFIDDYHKGLDLRAPSGRPVKATAGGVVKIARQYRLHGGTVGLDHGQGLSSIYIHLSQILVKPGQIVEKGETVGRVGATGFATGPHLHWGLFVNGLPVNPQPWTRSPAC